MKSLDILLTSAIAGTLALGAVSVPAAETMPLEKCYGIAKSGMNDCQTSKTACAGAATEDRQRNAWILLPKGSCEKIVGGHLESGN